MKNFILILNVSLIGALHSQPISGTEEERIEYYIKRPVTNYYDISFYENLYIESVRQFNASKEKLITRYSNSFSQYNGVVEIDLDKWQTLLSDPQTVQNYFRLYSVELEIYGVKIINADTSLFRLLYDNAKSKLIESQFGTSISWSVRDFISIPTFRNEHYMNPEQILFIYDVKKTFYDGVEDGKYVMYYEPIFDYKTQRFKTNVPYCHFEIRNKKTDGQAIFFSHLGDTIAQGIYVNGLQHGKWHLKLPFTSVQNTDSFEFAELSLDGKIIMKDIESTDSGWCEYDLEYSLGQLDGEFIFRKNGKLRSIGKILLISNRQVFYGSEHLVSTAMSEWKTYYTNGQLATKFELKPIFSMNKSVVFPWAPDFESTFDFSILYGNTAIPGYDEFNKSLLLGKNEYGYNLSQISNEEDENKLVNAHDSLIIEPPSILNNQKVHLFAFSDEVRVCHEQKDELLLYRYMLSKTAGAAAVKDDFILYHKNGQLMFHLNYSEDGKLTKVSPLYDCEGNIIARYLFNRDHTSAVVILKLQNKTIKYKVTFKKDNQNWKQIRFKPLFGFSELRG